MRTHVAFACAGLVATPLFAGCTVPVDPQGADETTATAAEEYTARPEYRFFSIRKNTNCYVRLCTGYFVKEVNQRTAERHVDSLKFMDPTLKELTLTEGQDIPDGGVVLRGYIGAPEGPWAKKALNVAEAFRGMPGVDTAHGDSLYRLSETFYPDIYLARELNTGQIAAVKRVDVSRAVMPHVEHYWLQARALHHGAIVAGHMHTNIFALDASQVFLRLPDAKGECAAEPATCAGKTIAAYTRDVDRCLAFDTCIERTGCRIPIVSPYMDVSTGAPAPKACADGYRQVHWVADVKSCVDYACEPAFIER